MVDLTANRDTTNQVGGRNTSENPLKALDTVGLGTMAHLARLWALPVAKLVGQSKIASNMTLGKFIGLHHIQRSLLYNGASTEKKSTQL